jgi:hypothetical protein
LIDVAHPVLSNQRNDKLLEDSLLSRLSENDRLSFIDPSQMETSAVSLTSAIAILVIGCGLVSSLFIYIVMNTRFFQRRFTFINGGRNKNNNKNVDINSDYLINGMYL